MYLNCQRVVTSAQVKTYDGHIVHAASEPKWTGCEIVADTQNVRYTMDNATDPVAGTVGMIFKTTDPPKTFLIEDVKRIRFTMDSGGAGGLNFHFFAGRDI